MERGDGVISLDGDENRLNLVKFGEIRFLGWQDRISVFHLLEYWSYDTTRIIKGMMPYIRS